MVPFGGGGGSPGGFPVSNRIGFAPIWTGWLGLMVVTRPVKSRYCVYCGGGIKVEEVHVPALQVWVVSQTASAV